VEEVPPPLPPKTGTIRILYTAHVLSVRTQRCLTRHVLNKVKVGCFDFNRHYRQRSNSEQCQRNNLQILTHTSVCVFVILQYTLGCIPPYPLVHASTTQLRHTVNNGRDTALYNAAVLLFSISASTEVVKSENEG